MFDGVTRLRKVQLELLEAFIGVCREHRLKWYAFFGTLLGAMRGNGYLTWDDDIDVVMPQEDYKELCLHREWFDDRYYLQTPLDAGVCNYTRLRKNGTTAFTGSFIDCLKAGGHAGISIDIIPLAQLPGMEAYHTPKLSNIDKVNAVYLKSWFEPAKEIEFEGLVLRIPSMPRKILNEVYGDWAWPHGVQKTDAHCWFFDTENGYEMYFKRYTGMLKDIDNKKIYLFGAADSLRIWLERFNLREKVICTFDNDAGKWGKKAYGVEVRNPSELPGLLDKDSRVIICSLWHQEIGTQLEKMGINDYYVYLDDYYDEKIGNKVERREDSKDNVLKIPKWE